MVTARYKPLLSRFFDPLAKSLSRLGVSPSVVTLAGLVLVFASCLYVLLTKHLLVFCGLLTIAGLFDVLDGAVARASGRVTKFGAYLDAVCDRYVEAAVVLSVAVVTGYWLLSMVVIIGALLTSYAKARAAMEVPIANAEWPDLMERGERSIVFGVGLVASQLVACIRAQSGVQARQALRQGQGGHHAPGHCPAVGQAEAGSLLQAVAQGVAEVEAGAHAPGFALIARDDTGFDST